MAQVAAEGHVDIRKRGTAEEREGPSCLLTAVFLEPFPTSSNPLLVKKALWEAMWPHLCPISIFLECAFLRLVSLNAGSSGVFAKTEEFISLSFKHKVKHGNYILQQSSALFFLRFYLFE